MDNWSKFKRWTILLILAAGAFSSAHAQYMPEVIKGPGERNALKQHEVNHPRNGQPPKVDRASGLVGMEITNPHGRILGQIQDVVINLKTGRVAYCVMGVGGLFNNQKLLALPLRAFQASPHGTHLILHANKQALAHAKGFNRHHWPSVNSNHPWGAHPFWKQHTSTNRANSPSPKARQKDDSTDGN